MSGVKPIFADLADLDVNEGGLVPVADDVVVGEGKVGGVDAVFEEGVKTVLFFFVFGGGKQGGGKRREAGEEEGYE